MAVSQNFDIVASPLMARNNTDIDKGDHNLIRDDASKHHPLATMLFTRANFLKRNVITKSYNYN